MVYSLEAVIWFISGMLAAYLAVRAIRYQLRPHRDQDRR